MGRSCQRGTPGPASGDAHALVRGRDAQRFAVLGHRAACDIDATVAEFQLALERSMDGDAPRIAHSDRFIVLDPKGHIRNFYPTSELGLDGLVADLDVIARGF